MTADKTRATPPTEPSSQPALVPTSVEEFMARAWAMEAEATQRYAEFADQMEVHNNLEVAELFRKLSGIEGKHRDQIAEQMGWTTPPNVDAFRWEGAEGPETADGTDQMHYLMQPWHALEIALHNERRAFEFFKKLSREEVPAEVRAAAVEMAEEEREHVQLIEEWIRKVPKPAANWDEDLDPPVMNE